MTRVADAGSLIVVANRLPVRRTRGSGGEWLTSPGGLVSALSPALREVHGSWIGWTGVAGAVPKPFDHDGIRNVPVELSAREIEDHYEGLSNSALWPLYHGCLRPPEYHRHWWRSHVAVNGRFAQCAAELAPPGASVWVQDYHLQLVPGMLRALRPDLRIGFFLHIPFPPRELFAQLPWRQQVLEGLLGADLVGFQAALGARNFRALVERFTDGRGERGVINFRGREVRYGHFPISIDFEAFDTQAHTDAARQRSAEIHDQIGDGRRILLGVDRLDYTKGIDIRIRAFRELLASGAIDPHECILVQQAVPSREHVGAYQELKAEVERQVGEINGEFATLGAPVVHYLHKSLPQDELVPLYMAADAMLVTPLRDGMNLVAKEYVACRPDERGALVLSEFTGAANELRQALIVNPYDIDGLAERIRTALALPEVEQQRRMRAMRDAVRKHDVHRWARVFLDQLAETYV
ncbi:MAG: trehalose-6-phosphate synthase [Planctomycetes bacterium]|nr:trehalose-6-phosphate synthase [Planctomycetota bacterium]